MIKVFAVVLHYKGKELTKKCLASLLSQEGNGFELEIVLVDNASPEPLKDLKKSRKVHFLQSKKNLGFSEGNNLGIKLALEKGADLVLIINNDTLTDKKLISDLLKVVKKKKTGGIFSPKIYFAPGYEYHQARYQKKDLGKVIWYAGGQIDWANMLISHRGVDEVDQGQFDRVEETEFISGCCMLIRKEVFNRIGFFDPKYFLYLEDADFDQRAKVAGFKLWFVPQSKLWHFNAGSSRVGGDLHDYFLTRNRLIFGLRFASLRTKLALMRESLRLFWGGRAWQKKGVIDFYLRRLGKGSWG